MPQEARQRSERSRETGGISTVRKGPTTRTPAAPPHGREPPSARISLTTCTQQGDCPEQRNPARAYPSVTSPLPGSPKKPDNAATCKNLSVRPPVAGQRSSAAGSCGSDPSGGVIPGAVCNESRDFVASGSSSRRSCAAIVSRIRKAFGKSVRTRSSSMIASSAVAQWPAVTLK